MAGAAPAQGPPALAEDSEEDLGVEDPKKPKKVYLVTLPRPKGAAKDGAPLKPPSDYTRKQIAEALLAAVAKTDAGRLEPLKVEKLCVFREKHKDGDLHDHVGLLADRAFRFAPVKKILLQDYSLASHWSCSHVGYASCVAYGYTPTQKKPFEELDKEPYLWPEGTHPPLSVASRAPVTAEAIAAAQEVARLSRSEEGKEDWVCQH